MNKGIIPSSNEKNNPLEPIGLPSLDDNFLVDLEKLRQKIVKQFMVPKGLLKYYG